jgi:hypothetical protein
MATLAFFAFLAATSMSGQRYFACAMMGDVSFAPCCEHAHDADDDAAISDDACCDAKRFVSPGNGVSAAARALLRAPFVARAFADIVAVPRLLPARARVRDARAGPDEPREYRSRLMISLT